MRASAVPGGGVWGGGGVGGGGGGLAGAWAGGGGAPPPNPPPPPPAPRARPRAGRHAGPWKVQFIPRKSHSARSAPV
ncbi:hypothetical protein, partial [Pseudomonas aeruginosa]|uniref:hypothetical protein n=1 Tax=Pseudomonas aeruginosa TaxID=287 RepID=UPI0039BDFB8F